MHVPVLAGPALGWLRVRDDGVYVDCTVGAGGHAALIAEQARRGRVLALDRDNVAVQAARARLASYPQATVLHRNYAELAAVLEELGIERVDGVLIDAGLSSMQLDTAERGFSFQRRGPLDMRMNPDQGQTARDWLHTTPEGDIARVLREYGDLKPARRIARAIVARRERGEVETTDDLAAAVKEALPHVTAQPEETRTVFQAVRMAVNEELRWLEQGVAAALDCLAPGGRFVAITFHSGEDRVVKQHLQRASRPQRELFPDGRVKAVHPPTMKILTPTPVRPTVEEIAENPRAASARLRAAERLAEYDGGSR